MNEVKMFETSKGSPWSAVTVPLVDTSNWFIKEREEAIRDLERIAREVQAAMAALIGSIPEGRDKTAGIARVCGVSNGEAFRRRKVAAVCLRFPAALELLHSGKVSNEHLMALTSVLQHKGAESLLDDAVSQSPEDFRNVVEQFRLHAEHGSDSAKRQHAQRHLRFHQGPDGMVGFRGLLPPVDGTAFKHALAAIVDANWRLEHPDRAATEGGHGGDGHEQRMADALLGLLGLVGVNSTMPGSAATATTATSAGTTDSPSNGHVTTIKTSKPAVVVTFNVDAWEAYVSGHGPVPVTASLFDQTRAELYYLFQNMQGEILKMGRARKEPTPLQRLAVMARDQHCIYPGCTVAAHLCEVHHCNEYLRDSGFTDVEVLGLLCQSHHRHIHVNDLKVIREDDGTVIIRHRPTHELIATGVPKRAAA